jgi:hypothetical protein
MDNPFGRKTFYCQTVPYTGNMEDPNPDSTITNALNTGSINGGYVLVSCTYMEKHDSFFIVWSGS